MLFLLLQVFAVPEHGQIKGPFPLALGTASIATFVQIALQNIILPAAAIAAFVMLVVSAYQFITSTGDPKAVDQARMRIWMSLLGFLIVAFSWFLLRLLEELTLPGPARLT